MAENSGRHVQPERNVVTNDADGSEPPESEGASLPSKCPTNPTDHADVSSHQDWQEESLTPGKEEEGQEENATGGLDEAVIECSVCLQQCVHPVQLPCSHIFCYLCVKGVANRSKRCALCRSEIPSDFINKPKLLNKEDLLNASSFDDGYQWFYSGNNSGWWRYDERTSEDLEEKYKEGIQKFEILIAGYLYIIDMEAMLQYRRSDPSRRRKIKRDQVSKVSTKGVAGLAINPDDESAERESGDGDNENTASNNTSSNTSIPAVQPSAPPLISSTPSDIHNNNRALLLRSALMQISPPITDTHAANTSLSRSPPVMENNNDSLMSRMRDLSIGEDSPRYLIPHRRMTPTNSEMRRRRRRERESFTSLTRINTDSSESD